MTSRASLLDLTLIKENLKRFWPIVMAAFMYWLVCGPFALAISGPLIGGGGYRFSMMRDILSHLNPAPILLDITLPVALSLAVFGYLHKTNSTGVMHAMPYSRTSLFVSNYISGLLMSLLPMLLSVLVLLPMSARVELPEVAFEGSLVTLLLRFALEDATVIAFVYSIAVFAASICGLSVLHTLTAVALNFICPVVFLLLTGYMEIYEYGFRFGSLAEDYIFRMNPYMQVMSGGGLTTGEIALYLGISLLISIAAWLAYRARQLEKTGDSYVFRTAKYIIGFLMIFGCSSLTGFVFNSSIGYASYALGFLVGYVVSQMIVNKSTRIFTKECLISGLVSAIVIAAVICMFRFDLIGYQTRVPQESRVERVIVDSGTFDLGLDGRNDVIEDSTNIARICDFHRSIVADKSNYIHGIYYHSEWDTTYINLKYELTNGKTLQRAYWLPKTMLRNSQELRDIWNSYEDHMFCETLDRMNAVNTSIDIESIEGDYWHSQEEDQIPSGSIRLAEKEALLKAVSEDLRNYEYDALFTEDEDMGSGVSIYIHIETRRALAPGENEYHISGSGQLWNYYEYDEYDNPTYEHMIAEVYVNENYVNTLEALRSMELSESLKTALEQIR